MNCENNRHYRALELDKILGMLADETSCADSREAALKIEPQTNLNAAEELMSETNDAHMLLARFGGPSFGGLKNVSNALCRADAGGMLNMRELLDIAEVLRVIRSLSEWRERCEGVKTHIDYYFNSLLPNKYLEDKITGAILSEDEIADNASDQLFDIRRKKRAASSRVREQLDRMTRSTQYQKYLQEPIVTMRNGRFVVPVKNECRGDVPGLVHDTSASGATVFIEPAGVVEANNEIKVLESKEKNEIERILYELSAEAGSFSSGIASSYDSAVHINLIFAKAQLAYKMKAAAPELNDKGIIDLKNARHPLIDPKKVVATDIRIGSDFDTLVITGPNTGGKTVSIKTIGLLTLMAMCGLMIPVSDQSKVSVFDRVLADIGDEQSIEQSLSTFSAHMTNIIDILGQADKKSLVLIDELGAGTDPVEGAALATSILEELHKKGAKVAATTHYAELKAYALQNDRIENGCCEFDVKTLRPTYRLLIGVPGRSNAFAISKRLGMNDSIVERAKELVSTEDVRFEDVVEKLESSRQNMEAEKEEAERLHIEADAAKREADLQKQNIQQMTEKELEKARGEAKRIVEKAKRESMAFLDELDRLKKEKNVTDAAELAKRAKAQIKSGLNNLEDTTNPVFEHENADENYVLPRPLKIGDTVLIADIGESATVVSLPDKSGNVEVQAGLMKSRVNISKLRLMKGKKKKNIPHTRTVRGTTSRADAVVKSSIDLRGKAVDEALPEIDMFIDNAIMAGINEITIIHGKGTGVLRAAVQKHLRTHPAIKSFRLGTFGEGENGVTIAELK